MSDHKNKKIHDATYRKKHAAAIKKYQAAYYIKYMKPHLQSLKT